MIFETKKEKDKLITIQTDKTTYQMMITENGYLLHLYYGAKVSGDMSYLLTYRDRGFSGNPYDVGRDRTFSLDVLPQEYSEYGNGDYRFTAFEMCSEKGVFGCDLRYKGHEILSGKYHIPGLPAVYCDTDKADTLKITLEDVLMGIEVVLYYGVLASENVITRAVSVRNIGKAQISIHKVYSGMLDFVTGDFDVIHFHGRHGMERQMERIPVITGTQSFGSRRGTSSHQHNPFFILAEKRTTEEQGLCYGMSLLYSGSFHAEIEKDQFQQTRMGIGLQDEMFLYPLLEGETFYAPEVAFACSTEGLADLSHIYHRLIRDHICRGAYQHTERPILINNWEATYFTFTGEKIIQIAKQAAELGVEMMVLDDGWFGSRDDDLKGLGDWMVNEKKMGGSLANVVEKINALGMKFGLWIEPEMVNEESELYRAHPDWAFVIPGKRPVRGRSQLVLDFSRKEVVNYIYEQINKVISAANIAYIKMDMNRSIHDIYTATQENQNQGYILYQYVLGVYSFLDKMYADHPDILIEGCSGGGGRFDAGMLYYTPQIWCSDNTDAIDRIQIQYGTSFGYPISAVGSHVSVAPNEQTGRYTNMQTRGIVAMAGSFGYELDLNKISEQEKEEVRRQIKECKKHWKLIHEGLYYRLTNPMENKEFAAWEYVSEDKKEALMHLVTLNNHCNNPTNYVYFCGLNPQYDYRDMETGKRYNGGALMYAGMPLPEAWNEYQSWQVYLKQEEK